MITDAAAHRLELKEKMMAWVSDEIDNQLRRMHTGQALQLTLIFDIKRQDGTSINDANKRYSEEAMAWRTAIFERDNYTCRECGSKGKLHAHHIGSWSEHPEKRYDLDNGVTLCIDCHSKKHPERANLILHSHYKAAVE